MSDSIFLPSSIKEQSQLAAKMAIKHYGLDVSELNIPLSVDESEFNDSHYQETEELYQSPHPDLVKAMFQQLKDFDESYTDIVIAKLMGASTNRTVRRWRSGEVDVPFTAWRKFLIATGRAPVTLPDIIGIFK